MANRFTVQPLGGFNLGGALSGLASNIEEQKRYDTQQAAFNEEKQYQQDTQAFMRQALDGDPVAMKELIVRNPQAGIFLQEQEAKRAAQNSAEQLAVKNANNLEYAKQFRFAETPEQQQAVIDMAIQDPNSDLYDESDIGKPIDQLAFDANYTLMQGMGDKAYGEFFKNQQPNKKLTNIQKTESGELIGQDSQGNWIAADLPSGTVIAGNKPIVQVGTSEKEEEKAAGAYRGKAFNQILKASSDANKSLATINTMERLSDKALSGSMADTKLFLGKFAKALGMDIEGIPESEAFIMMANSLTLDKAGQLSGALSDKDIAFLQASVPQLSQTKEGRKKVMSIMRDVAKIEKEQAKKAKEYKRLNNGTFDPVGFEEWVREQRGDKDILSKYFEGDFAPGETITLPSGVVVKKVG